MPRPSPRSTSPDPWVDPLLEALDSGREVLVLCQTLSSQRELLRRLVVHGEAVGRTGWAGLHVATLGAHLESLLPQSLGVPRERQEETLAWPSQHPWRSLLDKRPGLQAMLLEVVSQAREAGASGADLGALRPEIASLVRAGWGDAQREESLRALLASTPPSQTVFSLGFTSAQSSASPLARAVLKWLRATPLEPSDPSTVDIDSIVAVPVPDVVSEARTVVECALASPERVVVLVADGTTKERLRSAFQRNGVQVADDESAPLHRHSLSAVLTPLLPLFGDPRATLESVDLLRFLTDPVLSRKTPQIAHELDIPDGARASVRHVRRLISDCHRARGTLVEWLKALGGAREAALAELETASPETRESKRYWAESAQVVYAKVLALSNRAQGDRLGDVAHLINDIRLSFSENDWVGRSFAQALRAAADAPADARAFDAALTYTIGSRRIDTGVQILSYASYDGRDADLVLLTGVHSKGLTASPAPHPLLRESDYECLGLPTPAQTVAERVRQATWAVARSRRALAILSQTDATSRAVAPAIDLSLRVLASEKSHYGLQAELPEMRDANVFEEGANKEGTDTRGALQVDAEWARAGARFVGTSPPAPVADDDVAFTLLDHVTRLWGSIPERLKPSLGGAGTKANGEGSLPDGARISPSRMEAYTQCLYRAFLRDVLKVKKNEELTEDLDAREIGTGVHGALEQLVGTSLLVPEADLDAALERTRAKLEHELSAQIEKVVAERPEGTDSPTLKRAREGFVRRWEAHLPTYLANRIESLEKTRRNGLSEAVKAVLASPELSELITRLVASFPTSQQPKLRNLLRSSFVESEGDYERFMSALVADAESKGVSQKNSNTFYADVRAASSEFREACEEIRKYNAAIDLSDEGEFEITASEFELGSSDAPLRMRLGEGTYALTARLDALARRAGAGESGGGHRVIDFKTGTHASTVEMMTQTLLSPQLALYALALDELSLSPPVDSLELDYVKTPKIVTAAFDEQARTHARTTFGGLLDLARKGAFPLIPHPSGCPLTTRGSFCDYADVCRFRASTFVESNDNTPEEDEG